MAGKQLQLSDSMSWEKESLVDDGILNEQAYTNLLSNFLKLLQWYCAHKEECEGTVTENIVSQIICYTDKLMEVFNSPSSCIQLRTARLLQLNFMPILDLVMKISPEAFEYGGVYTNSKYLVQSEHSHTYC